MARGSHMRRLADDWPIIFAVCVALWFAIAAVGANGLSMGSDGGSSDDTSDASTASAPAGSSAKPVVEPVVAGPLKIKIASFSVEPNKKDPLTATAELTLELRNVTKENVNFYPSQVALRSDTASAAGPKETIVMGVSPNLAVTAPITFTVAPDASANYRLVYAGHDLYDGPAF